MPHNRFPQARLSDFDEPSTYVAHIALLQEMEYFYIWTSTSGVRAPSVAEASFYSLEGKLLCTFG